MRTLVSWFVRDPVAANLMMILILVGSVFGSVKIGKEFFPITNFKQKNLKFEFSTDNGRGREIEYYTSFIFSIDIKIKNKQKTLISGGRYNDLTSKNLGLRKIPAVGAAINLGVYE